jgi:glutamyl/glutaminyl-tRNA synthetase
MEDLLKMFDLEKVGKSGVKFSMEKLEYFNQMHIRKRFDIAGLNEDEALKKVSEWRELLIHHLPNGLHNTIREYDNVKL